MTDPPKKRLAVVVDGTRLADDEAHALWDRFSTWMEEHRGDLAGFAAQEGFVSIHPGVDGDLPILRASRSVSQQPYAAVRGVGGSPDRPGQGKNPDRRHRNPRKARK